MRRSLFITTSALALFVGAGAPAASGAEAATGGSAFDYFAIEAQSQAASGYLYAAGDEVNRLAGALAIVNKPENVNVIAAALQRGLVTGYAYGSTLAGGPEAGSGGTGLFPEPPPGEADAISPSNNTESTWEGALTTAAPSSVIDGRAHAKATDAPSGQAQFLVQHIGVPGQLDIDAGDSASSGGPSAQGIQAESHSLLRGITIADVVHIDSLLSRAVALAPSEPGKQTTGSASTIVSGATVNGVPVQITSKGLRLADTSSGGEQKTQLLGQVRGALQSAHVQNIRVVDATTKRGADGKLVVDAGMLLVTYKDDAFAAANPQGFGGGGFGIGGATVSLDARRTTATALDTAKATRSANEKDLAGTDRRWIPATAPKS